MKLSAWLGRVSLGWISLSCMLFACLLGCGGNAVAKKTENTTETRKRWTEMSFSERKSYMALVVLPEMKPLFQRFDAERYATFSCETCHGPDPSTRGFEVPSAHLMTLYPTGSAEQKAMIAEQRPMATFMYQKVLPAMTRLLDAEPWSDASRSGFSCFGCHTEGESEVVEMTASIAD